MNIDLGSFAFGSILEDGVGTPSWGTALGQSRPEYYITRDDAEALVMGMVYKSVPLSYVSLPLGRGGRMFNCLEAGTIQLASLFDKVFVNGQQIDYPFVIVLQKEDSASHSGRRGIKYTDKAEYQGKKHYFTNNLFVHAVQRKFGLSKDACWFVYDISVLNHEELHMKAIFVNKDDNEEYVNSRVRSEEWTKLIEDAGDSYNVVYEHSITKRNIKELSLLPYLTAIRTKPFLLLAGISGTGKSRIVRKLAQATNDIDFTADYDGDDRWKMHSPTNFCLIQVKPNWHNSMDVVGFKSNIGGAHYEFSPFIEFIAKAWHYPDTPFFLCLDEMNLAPVEEYFAEFLSAIESRSFNKDGEYETDPIIKPFNSFGEEVSADMIKHLVNPDLDKDCKIKDMLRTKGLTLPKNLIVMGTVNMDETTFSFSRKVLDRAMSIEMNEVDYDAFLTGETEEDVPLLTDCNMLLVERPINAQIVRKEIDADKIIEFLKSVNALLDGTPFKLGYRAANEAFLYVSAAKMFGSEDIVSALDKFTVMKILSRIEGDDSKLKTKSGDDLLPALLDLLKTKFGEGGKSVSVQKLTEMNDILVRDHFVSFWG